MAQQSRRHATGTARKEVCLFSTRRQGTDDLEIRCHLANSCDLVSADNQENPGDLDIRHDVASADNRQSILTTISDSSPS